MIRLLLVEDDPVWVVGIRDLLEQEPDLEILETVSNAEAAVQRTEQLRPDVVLLDLILEDNQPSGFRVALEISECCDTSVIMITSTDKPDWVGEAFASGAINYIHKSRITDLAYAIRAAYEGRSTIHESAASALLHEFCRLKSEEKRKLLTPVEREILLLIDKGHTQSQIQGILMIAGRTIKNHINRILKKMKVKSSKEAAKEARRQRLL